jgi:hypothetical protein
MNTETNESSEDKQQVIAFKDFKGAVAMNEFLAVLEIVNAEYYNLKDLHNHEAKFQARADEGIEQIKAQSHGMPPGLAEKLIDGLKRKANQSMNDSFSKELARHRDLTDFLNRFRDTSEQLPYLTFKNIK